MIPSVLVTAIRRMICRSISIPGSFPARGRYHCSRHGVVPSLFPVIFTHAFPAVRPTPSCAPPTQRVFFPPKNHHGASISNLPRHARRTLLTNSSGQGSCRFGSMRPAPQRLTARRTHIWVQNIPRARHNVAQTQRWADRTTVGQVQAGTSFFRYLTGGNGRS